MKGFIEITKAEGGRKVLLNVDKIEAVYPENEEEEVFISMSSEEKRHGKFHYGIFVSETYEQIKNRIEQATGEGN